MRKSMLVVYAERITMAMKQPKRENQSISHVKRETHAMKVVTIPEVTLTPISRRALRHRSKLVPRWWLKEWARCRSWYIKKLPSGNDLKR